MSRLKFINSLLKQNDNSAHAHSSARPASAQQHRVTTSPHFADEWLQQNPPADSGIDVDQHADDAHDQGRPLTNLQECLAHSKLLHNCPQIGEGDEDTGWIDAFSETKTNQSWQIKQPLIAVYLYIVFHNDFNYIVWLYTNNPLK